MAVAGATGRLGRHVVDILEARGHRVVPMSRQLGVDLVTGEGLAAALEGVDCVVDVSTGPSPDQKEATDYFTTATGNLHRFGEQAGVEHLVMVSIIGIDRFAGGYYDAKLAQETAALAGPLPAGVLRAAQFDEFVETLVEWGRRGDVAYLPPMRTQLVAARSVAEVLVDLAADTSAIAAAARPPFPEVAGPRPEELAAAGALLMARRGDRVRVETTTPDPSDRDAALASEGALLPGLDAILLGPTFEEWLDSLALTSRR
jgi:uncharacterized protein YbjT (DUF2867 family)